MSLIHDSTSPVFSFAKLILFYLSITLFNSANALPIDTNDGNAELTQTDIAVGEEEIGDQAIKDRLRDIYANMPSLSNIQVSVDAGIVTLSGALLSKEAHDTAMSLANRLDGVVSVNDEMEIDNTIQHRVDNLLDKVNEIGDKLLANLPIYLLALFVFIFFWFLSRLVSPQQLIFTKISSNTFLQTLLSQISRGIIILLGFILTLEILDATALLGTILGAAGIFGLALGFAIRDTVENYIASILLSLRQPFAPNDHIVLEGYEGKVIRLTSRDTILMTLDGNHVRIPNAAVYKGNILNYTRNALRRFSFEIGIDTEVEIQAAQKLAIDTLLRTPGVIPEPGPHCRVEKLGDSNVILTITAWTNQSKFDYAKVRSEAIRAIKEQYDCANFEMPEPIYRLKIQNNLAQTAVLSSDDEEMMNTGTENKTKTGHQPIFEPDIAKETYIDEQIRKDKLSDDEPDLLQP